MFGSTFTGGGSGGGGGVANHGILECRSGQIIANGAYPVTVQLTTTVKDNAAMCNTATYTITAKKTALYEIIGVVIFNNAFPDRANGQALIHINGVLDTYQICYTSHATGAADQPAMARVLYYKNLNIGDAVTLIAFQNSGAAVGLSTTLGWTQLSVKESL